MPVGCPAATCFKPLPPCRCRDFSLRRILRMPAQQSSLLSPQNPLLMRKPQSVDSEASAESITAFSSIRASVLNKLSIYTQICLNI